MDIFNDTNSQKSFKTLEDFSNIKSLEDIFNTSIKNLATDIHLEPKPGRYILKFRVNGLIIEIKDISYNHGLKLISQAKVLSNLDITEKRLPQDGSINLEIEAKNYNIRISTCYTIFGERIVFRILNNTQNLFTIDNIGLSTIQENVVRKALEKQHGLIITTGPTGSGKTSTIYAILQQLSKYKKNIVSIEDPVEIRLDKITQININKKIGLDFPEILRAILRQDPDIIMIGEIRDQTTANIAIQASLSGHLVLTTTHANSFKATIDRLENFAIDRKQVKSAINMLINQRLAYKKNPTNNINTLNARFGIFDIFTKQSSSKKFIRYSPKSNV